MENNGLNRIKVMLVEKIRLQNGSQKNWVKTQLLYPSGVLTSRNRL